jgi:hypothetical protein
MTEAEWLTAADPLVMLAFINAWVESRKELLLMQACIERVRNVVSEQCSAWGNLAGRVADDYEPLERLCGEWESVEAELNSLDLAEAPPNGGGRFYALLSILTASWVDPTVWESGDDAWFLEREKHSDLVRDIFGNPFRPVTLVLSWLTPDIVALTGGIYADRAFDRLPILADALQDAGCDNDDLLSHLRGPGPHVKGCWALDLLLGKR